MEYNDYKFDVLYTDEMLVQLSKHIMDPKRKRLYVHFSLISLLSAFLIILDLVGPDNIHTLYAGVFFSSFSALSLTALIQTRLSNIRKNILMNRVGLPIKSSYTINSETITIETVTMYSKSNVLYEYYAIKKIEKIASDLLYIFMNDSRTAIVKTDKAEEIYNYLMLRIQETKTSSGPQSIKLNTEWKNRLLS